MSMINKEIGEFTVQAYHQGAFKPVSKADVLGKWAVFFFYPADFTFVCPTELEDLANKYADFQAAGCEVYSVSCDTHFVHKAWHDSSERIQKLQYPMLADPTHALAKDFEVYIETEGVAERGTFVVNPEGKIVAYEVNAGNAEMNARLTGNVDLSGICGADAPWTPIGNKAAYKDYRGTFDGQGHKITGLYLENKGTYNDGSSYYTALFGLCDGATIKNVSVYGEGKSITRYVAGIVGRACGVFTHRTTTIENCHNYVTLTGTPTNDQIYGHAGVVASAQDTVIRSCSNQADITGYEGYTGGIVAVASSGSTVIENCWNTGDIHLRGWESSFRGVGGIAGCVRETVEISNCYNTGSISFYYRTQRIQQSAGGIVGAAGYSSSGQNITLTNCYSIGAVSGEYDDNANMGALVGEVVGASTVLTVSNCWYLDSAVKTSGAETTKITVRGEAFTAADGLDAAALGSAYADSCPAPVLQGEPAEAHTDADNDGVCDVCGRKEVPVPTRKADYPAESENTVMTGTAYLLSDLQAGKIFAPVDGQSLQELLLPALHRRRHDLGPHAGLL